MTKARRSGTADIRAALDQAPFAVYVNALTTWEVLYLNEPAKRLMNRQPRIEGACCYELMGFDQPCPYCRIEKMTRESLTTREFYHPILKRTFQLSGKLIDWNGVPAHIEYIVDVTEKKLADEASRALSDELQAVLRNIPGGLCVYRFDGQDISPVFHNDAFYDLLGYSDEHVFRTQTTTENLNVHPDDIAELNRRIAEAIRGNQTAHYVYRVFNDKLGEYRRIRLDGSAKRQKDGSSILYGLYTDVTEQYELEQKLADESVRTQNIINAIPGGVAIYRVSDRFETVYFSDGVPELTGYTVEEYRELVKCDAAELIYPADREAVLAKVVDAMADQVVEVEFRKTHRDGRVVWVHMQTKKIGEDNGRPLLQCVFHNITALKETQEELDHLLNSVPGGIAVYHVEDGRCKIAFYTDGVPELGGYTREEFDALTEQDAIEVIFERDRQRIIAGTAGCIQIGSDIELSFRLNHKDGHPVWVHLNGKLTNREKIEIYAVITGMSAETKLYQNIANEAADGVYVIDRNSYELLYINESLRLFAEQDAHPVGKKCYAALHGKTEPCEFCTICTHAADGVLHEMRIPDSDRIYQTRFRETDWNGISAYIKFVSDITEEDRVRRQKERLEQYFQTLVKNLPGGVVVMRYDGDSGNSVPEFISDGFAAMCGMTAEQVREQYGRDAHDGVHPDDAPYVEEYIHSRFKAGASDSFDVNYRLRRADGEFIWVKNTLTFIHTSDGDKIYSVYSDITHEINEQARMRELYNDMLIQHHQPKDPDLIIAVHSSLTDRKVRQITDRTDSRLLERFGNDRDAFFTGLSGLITDEEVRRRFLLNYLTDPLEAAFRRGETKHEVDCFVVLPDEQTGRYVHFSLELIKSPDTGELMGVLSVLDYTERRISENILHRLAQTNHDFIADVDLFRDRYKLLSFDRNVSAVPEVSGSYSGQAMHFLQSLVVPKDRDVCAKMLDVSYIKSRLAEESSYSFHYTIVDENGEAFTKKMVVFYIDRRLERICLARTDITESVREQRQLLNILAYTFDLACFIDARKRNYTMHTRDTVLGNLPPYSMDSYDEDVLRFVTQYGDADSRDEVRQQFTLDYIFAQLKTSPQGYEFIFPYRGKEGLLLYKQINVLWGDENHHTICMVRADVTEILAAERQTKEHLKNALAIAQEANRAKTDFLSAMSHDIRTPMNAIVGMTDLALSDRDNAAQIDESLNVIKSSSEHLLHLINDILDMSRIESGKMVMNREPFDHLAEMEKTVVQASVLAERKGLNFRHLIEIWHRYCIGDVMRIRQILDNLIGNAVKFTPKGGEIALEVTELPQKNDKIGWYRFVVEDNGIGMDEETTQRIFEPFYRASASNLRLVEGTGLGLSIVKSIVDYKGGVIAVNSVPGKGTRFTVDLPIHFAEASEEIRAETAASEAGAAENLEGARILLVEDHPVNQLVARRILEKMGACVTIAENGKEGYEAFAASATDEYAAICMDVQMPVMDGYEATRAIRACGHPRAKSIPIIAMTANAFAQDVKRCLEAGMNAHVAKPIDPLKLFQLLRSFIG